MDTRILKKQIPWEREYSRPLVVLENWEIESLIEEAKLHDGFFFRQIEKALSELLERRADDGRT